MECGKPALAVASAVGSLYMAQWSETFAWGLGQSLRDSGGTCGGAGRA